MSSLFVLICNQSLPMSVVEKNSGFGGSCWPTEFSRRRQADLCDFEANLVLSKLQVTQGFA